MAVGVAGATNELFRSALMLLLGPLLGPTARGAKATGATVKGGTVTGDTVEGGFGLLHEAGRKKLSKT